jgi:hypothetical protein
MNKLLMIIAFGLFLFSCEKETPAPNSDDECFIYRRVQLPGGGETIEKIPCHDE